MLYVCPKSGAIFQSKINIEFTCTCTYNVLLVRILHVSLDWIEIQFTKKNSCFCYMSIHVPVFTINLTFSPLDVALQLAVDSFIPQPSPFHPIPPLYITFVPGMSSSLWIRYWFYLPFLHNKQFHGVFFVRLQI